MDIVYQVLRIKPELHTALTGGDINLLAQQAGLVDICRERFLHPYGAATAAYVTC